jgi:hypothetical protein
MRPITCRFNLTFNHLFRLRCEFTHT